MRIKVPFQNLTLTLKEIKHAVRCAENTIVHQHALIQKTSVWEVIGGISTAIEKAEVLRNNVTAIRYVSHDETSLIVNLDLELPHA